MKPKQINCQQAQAVLIPYLRSDLPVQEQRAIREHIRVCPGCTRALQETERLEVRLFTEAAGHQPGLSPQSMQRMQARLQREARKGVLMQRTRALAVGLVGLVVMVVLVSGGADLLRRIVVAGEPVEPRPVLTVDESSVLGENTVITFAAEESQRRIYEPLITAFHEEYPEITVQWVAYPQEAYRNASILASTADTYLLPGRAGLVAGSSLDLLPLVDVDSTFDQKDYWPGLFTACQTDGSMYGLPIAASPTMVFLDRAAFEAAGQPVPAPEWTWADFQQAARVLAQQQSETGPAFVAYGSANLLVAPGVDAMLVESGGVLDPASMADRLRWYMDLAQEGVLRMEIDQDEMEESEILIENRQAPMWVDTLSNISWRRRSLGDDLALAPFPALDGAGAARTTPATPLCAAISTGTRHRQASWTWLKYLSEHPVRFDEGFIPARPSAAEETGYWAEMAPDVEAALRFALAHAWYGSEHPQGTLVVERSLQEAITAGADLELALARETPPAPPAPAQSAPLVVATPQPTPGGDGLTVFEYYVSSFVHTDPDTVKALAQEFRLQHPDLQVKLSFDLPGVAGQPVTIADMANSVDCFAWPGRPDVETKERLYSLDPFLEQEGQALAGDFYPDPLEQFRVDGELYGLPVSSLPAILYYNADYLAGQGLTAPGPTWTLDDFLSLAESATGGNGQDQVYGFVPFQGNPLGFLLAARGISLSDLAPGDGSMRLDDPEVVSAFTWLKDLAGAGVIPPGYGESYRTRAERLLVSGKAATWVDLAGLRGAFTAGEEVGFRIGAAPLPAISGELPPALVNGFYISQKLEAPGACWEWGKFLSAHPNASIGIPARRSVAESPAWEAVVGSETAAAYRAAIAQPQSAERLDAAIQQWLEAAFTAVLDGEDPAVALAEAQRKVDVYVACLSNSPLASREQREACAQQAG